MIYPGENSLSREDLRKIPVPERENVSYWQGIQHGELADTIIKQLQERDCETVSETWQTAHDNNSLFGAVDIKVPARYNGLEGANFSLGVRHSNHGLYALSFAVGARITVCSNGLFVGDFLLTKKHSSNLNLPEVVGVGIERYLSEIGSVKEFIVNLQEVELSDRTAEHVLIEAARKKIIGYSQLQHIDNLWVNPPYDDFKEGNAWSLYNAFTQYIKGTSATRQMQVLSKLKNLFYTELLPDKAPAALEEKYSEDLEFSSN